MRMKRLLCRGRWELESPYFCYWIAVLLNETFCSFCTSTMFFIVSMKGWVYTLEAPVTQNSFTLWMQGFWSSFFFFWQKLLVERPPGGSDCKESACSAGDLGLILGLGRSPGEGNCYPLQNSCLENSMDRGAWRATVHGVTKNLMWLSD